MFPTRRRVLTAGLLAGLGTLPGLARAQRTDRGRDGILRYGLSAYPPNLQPWVSTGASAGTVKMLIHRSLVAWDEKGELRGEIAESWAPDGTAGWTFRLRPGIRFHDGSEVTAEDVKWTVEQIGSERSTAYMRAQFQTIERVEIPDPRTIRLITKEPQATLPIWFANYNVHVVSRRSTQNEWIGCGPFRVTGGERGTSVELTAFDRYYKTGFPKLRGIRFIAYADENLRTAALQAGDVDMIEYVPWQSMGAVESDPRLKLDATEGPFMDILFNGGRPPFDDPRVRRAIAHAVRREEIVRAAFFGRGKVLEGMPITEGTPYWDAELSRGHRYDPERAKALLREAGHPNGFSATMLATAQFGMHKDTAEIVQQHLGEIGIRTELQLPDWSTRVNRGIRGQYEIAIHGVANDSNDPDGLTVVLDTSLSPAHGRSFNLRAPRTTAALARGRAEFDEAKRVEIYKDMQRAALEEVPLVGLAWRSQGYGMDRRVQGFVNLPGALSTASGIMLEAVSLG